jgi:hypothetical protein
MPVRSDRSMRRPHFEEPQAGIPPTRLPRVIECREFRFLADALLRTRSQP